MDKCESDGDCLTSLARRKYDRCFADGEAKEN